MSKYFPSNRVKVFPCAYRGQYLEGQANTGIYDLESRLNTEYNMTHIACGWKDSYLIDWKAESSTSPQTYTLVCVIGGYYFEVTGCKADEFYFQDNDYVLYLDTQEKTLRDAVTDGDSKRTTKILKPYGTAIDDLDGNFTGIILYHDGEATPAGFSYIAKLKPFINKELNYEAFLPNIRAGKTETAIQCGTDTVASGDNSVALGLNTYANQENLMVIGKYNEVSDKNNYAFIIGNGTSDTNRSNLLEVQYQKSSEAGKVNINGKIVCDDINCNNHMNSTSAYSDEFMSGTEANSLKIVGGYGSKDDCYISLVGEQGSHISLNTEDDSNHSYIKIDGKTIIDHYDIKNVNNINSTSITSSSINSSTETVLINGNLKINRGWDLMLREGDMHLSNGSVYLSNGIINLSFASTETTISSSSITTQSIQCNEINGKSLLNWFYPVGTIYTTTSEALNSKEKMEAYFGGEWEAFAPGQTIIGVGEYTDSRQTKKSFVVNEAVGIYDTPLSIDNLPAHYHSRLQQIYYTDAPTIVKYDTLQEMIGSTGTTGRTDGGITVANDSLRTGYTGSNVAHNNIQPSIACYVWKRTK